MKIKRKSPFYSSILCHPFAEEERKKGKIENAWKCSRRAKDGKPNADMNA